MSFGRSCAQDEDEKNIQRLLSLTDSTGQTLLVGQVVGPFHTPPQSSHTMAAVPISSGPHAPSGEPSLGTHSRGKHLDLGMKFQSTKCLQRGEGLRWSSDDFKGMTLCHS